MYIYIYYIHIYIYIIYTLYAGVIRLYPPHGGVHHVETRSSMARKVHQLHQHKVRLIWGFLKIGLPSGNLTVCYWKWPLIVDFPIKNGDVPVRYVSLPEATLKSSTSWMTSFSIETYGDQIGSPIGQPHLSQISWPKFMSQGICSWPPRYNWSFKPAHVHCLDPIFCLVKSVS